MACRGVFRMMPGILAVVLASGEAGAQQTARADLRNAQGERVGNATFVEGPDGLHLSVQVMKMAPGFHGFHVHAVGKCDPPDFTSAGGHLNPAGKSHPEHAGDLPALLVNADGTGWMTFKIERFKFADLFDADGSALIVHAGPDNYAHIPNRYQPSPDASTLGTGDAGGRVACAIIMK